ncbi:tRNA (guanine(26)-N(2))-dimethyltransferase, mitochondrial [Trichomonascus vanleenenianus]|uniref:tRNA (guanine26-N2)-dimethyltransferase n=1 Tax=Trichomonascus vanleenenianus TaxID=2268995 RepID=UPI003EC96321
MSDKRKYDETKFSTVTEGTAEILYPKQNSVFYNPVQQFNRDLSVLGIRAWAELYRASRGKKRSADGETRPTLEIIEALSATGLRAVRYGKEIPGVKTVYANDMSPSAVEAIRLNIEHNRVEETVIANQDDASLFMYKHKQKRVHVVDLDPYGSATPFVDAAVQAVADDGLMLVTCTDLAILAGNAHPEKCFAQYGGTTVHNDACQESALRLALNMVATTAAKYGRVIEPLASFSIDFYIRMFIRVRTSPQNVKLNHSKTMVVYHCSGCGAVVPQTLGKATPRANNPNALRYSQSAGPIASEKCSHCDSLNHIAGPMWAGPLHSKEFLEKLLEVEGAQTDDSIFKTLPRVRGMATLALQEIDEPFFFSLPAVSKVVKAPCPPTIAVVSALLNAGYTVSETHVKRSCIKTNAPWSFIWNIMRAWIKKERGSIEKKNIKETSPGAKILDKDDPFVEVSFKEHPGAREMEDRRKSKLVRFQMNPAENWGPKARAR